MTDVETLLSEIVSEATDRHHAMAIEYWNGLRLVIDWWDSLPSNLRQDIEGSGREPYAIVKARRLASQHRQPH